MDCLDSRAPVYSIEDGKIVEIHQSQTNTHGYIHPKIVGQQVGSYHHINIGKIKAHKNIGFGDIVKAYSIS